MYDFETLGQSPDTVVVSLGAVAFNRADGVLGKKYWVFDWEHQPGRSIDPSTQAWWDRQSFEAKLVFSTPKEKRISLDAFIKDNDQWIEGLCFELNENRNPKTGQWKELKPMSNGANFDLIILEDIYRKHHAAGRDGIPWAFYNTWCFRTFDHLFKIKENVAKNVLGEKVVKHNALADALWQTKCVLDFWKRQDAKRAAQAKTTLA